jgi:dual specificity phosphatase 3
MTTTANISWVLDDLATGGDLSLNPEKAMEQVVDLTANHKVKWIIDMRQEANDHDIWNAVNEADESLKIVYTWLPTDDAHGHTLPNNLFDEAVKIDRRARKWGGKVFVHCHMGINRGPSVAFGILLDRGYGIEEAFDMIREARPVAGIYYAFDALNAHHDRRAREKNLGFDVHAETIRLREHISRTMTDEVWGGIQHIIRENHEQDRMDLIDTDDLVDVE